MSLGGRSGADVGTGFQVTSPADAASAIIEGVEKGSYRVVIGTDARMLDAFARLAQRRATETIAKKMGSLIDR